MAAALAVAAMAATAGLRAIDLPGGDDAGIGQLAPALAALALLCLSGLAWRAEPVALLLLVGASGVAAADAIDVGRAIRSADPALEAWPLVAVVVGFEATGTATIAGIYVARRTRRLLPRLLVAIAVAWLGASCAIVVAATALGAGPDPALTWLDIATVPQLVWPHLVLAIIGAGVALDLVPAIGRAWRHVAAVDAAAGRLSGLVPPPGALARAVLDEIDPSRRRVAGEAAEEERRRLASDLHASVLPALRSAIVEADELGSPDLLGRRLRDVQAEIEALVLDRRFVVLDELGLVEALEWLAERVEERAAVRVELSVHEDGDGAGSGRPPVDVEQAAFRVARLALDNAVRHSAAACILVQVACSAHATSITIADDGRGWDAALFDQAVRAGRRGVVDMRRAAEGVGASLAFGRSADGRGTRVAFSWSAG